MPVLNLDARDPEAPARAAAAAARLPPGAPVVAMVHGFRYVVGGGPRCPTRWLFAEDGGWPSALGLSGADDAGLAIGFGWDARGSIWRAVRHSAQAAEALVRVAEAVARVHGPVDVLGHSLGARVGLLAAGRAPAGRFGRLILLAAASFRGEAQAMLATPGGRSAEVFNVTSGENDLFDRVLELCLRRRPGSALGGGLGEVRAQWTDIATDQPEVLAALRGLGFPVAPAQRRVCHWSGYLRPGLLPFYAALLRDRADLPMALIQSLLPDPARSIDAMPGRPWLEPPRRRAA